MTNKEMSSFGETSFHSLCSLLQRGVAPELDRLHQYFTQGQAVSQDSMTALQALGSPLAMKATADLVLQGSGEGGEAPPTSSFASFARYVAVLVVA